LQHLQLTVFSNAKDMIRIEAMFIGEPREISDDKETWLSGIYRSRVEGQIELRENRLVGDRVVDNKNHGRPGQAVCVHPITHYDFWNDVWAVCPRRNFPHLYLFGKIGDQQHHAAWLGETDDGNLKELLLPYPADQMHMWEISPRVNSPKNDDPSLWEPLHAQPTKATTDALELLRE
jgi:hypothetical protein